MQVYRSFPILPAEESELAEGVRIVPGVEDCRGADVDPLVRAAAVQDCVAHGVVLSLAPHHVHGYLLGVEKESPSVDTFPPSALFWQLCTVGAPAGRPWTEHMSPGEPRQGGAQLGQHDHSHAGPHPGGVGVVPVLVRDPRRRRRPNDGVLDGLEVVAGDGV